MSAALHFARAEWRMQRRSLRSWLLLALMAFLSRYFFMHQYGLATDAEGWRQMGGTLAAWALDPIGAALALSGLLFSIDAAGWGERPAYREILFPRPFSNGALVLGRFLGIYAVLCLACLAPPITLAALVGLPGGPSLDVAACVFVILHVWLPALAMLTASALWIRGLVPGTLGAAAAALAGWATLCYLSLGRPSSSAFHLPLDLLRTETGYVGGAGLLLLSRPLWGFMLIQLGLAACFLAAAAFALDRTGRRVTPRGARWWQIPTLRALFLSFWPGTSPGKTAIGLLLAGAGSLLALAAVDYRQYHAHMAMTRRLESDIVLLVGPEEARRVGALDGLEKLILGDPPAPATVQARDVAYRFDPAEDELTATATLTVQPASDGEPMLFLLNPGLAVGSVKWSDGRAAEFQRRFNQLQVAARTGEATLLVDYHGTLVVRQADSNVRPEWDQYQAALPARRFVDLPASLGWFPEPAAVERRGAMPAHEAAPPQPAPFIARAQPVRGLAWVAGGEQPAPGQWHSYGPARDLGLMLGPYRVEEGTLAALPLRLYHFPGSAHAARVYLWDSEILVHDLSAMLGAYPFPRLTVVETPVRDASSGGAALLTIRSRDLMAVARTEEQERQSEWVDVRQRFRYLDAWQVKLLQDQLVSDYLRSGVVALSPLLGEALPNYVSQFLESRERALAMQEKTREFDVPARLAGYYRMPLGQAAALRYPERAEVLAKRGMALFHMLRFRLGEEKWLQLLHAYAQTYRFKPARWEDFLRLAETQLGEDLSDFQREWIDEGALPQYQIVKADAIMFDDPRTLGMDYKVTLEVANRGTGSTPAPIYLRTEQDRVWRSPRIRPGESVVLTMVVPDRPLFIEVDPQGWILQLPGYMQESDNYAHDYRKVEIWERTAGR